MAETLIDSAFSLCVFLKYGIILILFFSCPELMKDSSLGPTNVFFMFGAISSIGFFYCGIFIKETKELLYKDK
jgi:hypothetical protein